MGGASSFAPASGNIHRAIIIKTTSPTITFATVSSAKRNSSQAHKAPKTKTPKVNISFIFADKRRPIQSKSYLKFVWVQLFNVFK